MTKKKLLGDQSTTGRGFSIVTFKDYYGCHCSLQQSSLAEVSAVWLGIDDAEPKILASRAGKFGIKTDETEGWIPYPVPDDVLLSTRMHLSREQVEGLVARLQEWLKNGEWKGE